MSNFGLDTPILPPTPPLSLAAAIENLPPGSKWAVSRFDATDNGHRIAQAIRNGTAIALSDGSYKDAFGTSAIIIEAEDADHNIIAVNVVPGNPSDQNSYRSELAGIFGQITLVNAICRVHSITQGTIESGCDGSEALCKVFAAEEEASTDGSQFDLLSATRAALRKSPITWHFRHVKGHQDSDPDTELDHWALLNVDMDSLAKMYWLEQVALPQPAAVPLTGEYWPVSINGRKVNSALRTTLYDEIYRKKMALHWEKRDRMSQASSQVVNWDACAAAMKRLKISRRHWVAKHTEGMCGVGKWLVIWKEQESDACPRCSASEDARHVWQCPAEEAAMVRTAGLDKLAQWMTKEQTDPEIHRVLLVRLSQLLNHLPLTPIATHMEDLQAAIDSQDAIGWDNFFEGCIALEWERVQAAYYAWCRSKKSGRRWTTALITKLWDIAWDLWEQRIGIFHGQANAETLHGMIEVDNSICTQYHCGPGLLSQRDHHLFNRPLSDILDESITYRQRWLLRVETARERVARWHALTFTGERQLLHNWLHGNPDGAVN